MTTPSTSALTDLLARVRAAKPGENGEDGRLKIARDWCKLWIGRDDYPEVAYLITDAFSEIKAALGSAVALAEHVLPGLYGDVDFGNVRHPRGARLFTQDGVFVSDGEAATPALALLCAVLSALIGKETEG